MTEITIGTTLKVDGYLCEVLKMDGTLCLLKFSDGSKYVFRISGVGRGVEIIKRGNEQLSFL